MTGILQSKVFVPVQFRIRRLVMYGPMVALVTCLGLLAGCTSQGPVFPMVPNLTEWQISEDQIDSVSDVRPALSEHSARFRLAQGDQRSLLVREDEWSNSRKFLLGFDVMVLQSPSVSQRVTLARLVRPDPPNRALVSVDLTAQSGITVAGQACVAADQLAEWRRIEVRVFFSEARKGYVEVFCDRRPVYALLELETGYPPGCGDNAACGRMLDDPVPYEWQVGLVSERPVGAPVDVQMRRMQQRPLVWTPNRVRG